MEGHPDGTMGAILDANGQPITGEVSSDHPVVLNLYLMEIKNCKGHPNFMLTTDCHKGVRSKTDIAHLQHD